MHTALHTVSYAGVWTGQARLDLAETIRRAGRLGYDGVMMMGCKKGDDYQCHFVKGSELAHYRMSKIGDTLTQLGLEPERVVTQEVAITDNQRVVTLINDYVAQINELGMSPMKAFN